MTSPMGSDQSCPLDSPGGRCELDVNLEILRSVPVFSEVPLQCLRVYAYMSRRIYYKAGSFLFRQGDMDDRGYIILSGRAQVVRELKESSILLDEFREGDFLGGLALFSNIRRLFSVRALTDLECLTLDREAFQKLLVQFPSVAVSMLDVMIRRIVTMEERLLQSEERVYG